MSPRRKMQTRYRRFSQITDVGGIKSAIGEMRGLGYPKQPVLNKDARARGSDARIDGRSVIHEACASTGPPCGVHLELG